jgi:hypothetical protein
MNDTNVNWGKWRTFFASRHERALPALEDPQD